MDDFLPQNHVKMRVEEMTLNGFTQFSHEFFHLLFHRHTPSSVWPVHFRKRHPTLANLSTCVRRGSLGRPHGGFLFPSSHSTWHVPMPILPLVCVHLSWDQRNYSGGQLFCARLCEGCADEGSCKQANRQCVSLTLVGGPSAKFWSVLDGFFFLQPQSSHEKNCAP